MRLTYSNVVATIALFGVLAGGVAVGAALKKNSVGKKQLKKNAVVTKKLSDGAVTTPKLADGAATGAKVDESSLGTVPSALEASNAQDAQTAQSAANSQALGGSPLASVRATSASTSSNPSPNTVLEPTYVDLLTREIAVPPGGGSLVASASIDLINAAPSTAESDCILQSGRNGVFAPIGQQTFSNFPAVIAYDIQVPLVARKPNVAEGTETVKVSCRETSGTLEIDRGDLVIQVVPGG
jgi:hypothetical protein